MDIYTIPLKHTEVQDKYLLYRPLAGLAFVGNRAMADLTLAMMNDEEGILGQDQYIDFIRNLGFLDPAPPGPSSLGSDFNPTTAVLLLTNQCQLRCTYCYAAAGEFTRRELSFELGKAVIDYIVETAQRLGKTSFDVSFHGGGEPTLAWKVMEACVLYIRQQPLPAKITLTSNGIWPVPKLEWLLQNIDGLSLSMDGSPPTQDRQRPHASGRGSSSEVMRTIAELDRRKFPYGIRMTATAPWENFPRDVSFLCAETKCPSIQVEPAFNIQRGGHAAPDQAEAHGFAEAFVTAYEIASRAGRRLIYSGARLGQITPTFCQAPYNALVVNANGDIVTCYEVASEAHPLSGLSVMGRVEDGKVRIDLEARARLHSKMAERRAMCRSCFCYWSCAGDCYARTFTVEAEGHLQYGARCETNRFITEKLLLNAIAEGDGTWRASTKHSSVSAFSSKT